MTPGRHSRRCVNTKQEFRQIKFLSMSNLCLVLFNANINMIFGRDMRFKLCVCRVIYSDQISTVYCYGHKKIATSVQFADSVSQRETEQDGKM